MDHGCGTSPQMFLTPLKKKLMESCCMQVLRFVKCPVLRRTKLRQIGINLMTRTLLVRNCVLISIQNAIGSLGLLSAPSRYMATHLASVSNLEPPPAKNCTDTLL